MNQEFVKLLGDRGDEVNKFLASINEVRAEMRGKARDLGKLVDVEPLQNVQQGDWRPTIPLHHCLYHVVHKDEKQYVGIDAAISPGGWEIQIFPRQGVARSEVDSLLNELEIPFEDSWRCIYPKRFAYDEDLNVVAPVVKDLVEKIAAHSG